jgi:hypothetical protein
MAILCHRWWPLQESVFFALEGEPVLDAGHALYCSTYYSRAVSVARSHTDLSNVVTIWLRFRFLNDRRDIPSEFCHNIRKMMKYKAISLSTSEAKTSSYL